MNKLDNLEYVTAVDLNYTECIVNKKSKPVYHFIYASQLYGTFFGIYAKFDGTADDKKTTYNVNKISLRLVNYKGYVNIGFTNHQCGWDPKKGKFNFRVRGACTLLEKEFEFKAPIPVKKGKRCPLIFDRILHPLLDFEDYYEDRNGSTLSRQLTSEPPTSPIFDGEFNERDGIDFYDRDLKPGMNGAQIPLKSKEQIEIVGIRCITSKVNLYF